MNDFKTCINSLNKYTEQSSIVPYAVDVEESTIPMFNLSEIEMTTGIERQERVAKLVDAFKTIGFGALYAPNLDEMHENVFKQAHLFFDLDKKIKLKYCKNGFGYVPHRQEQLRGESIGYERYRYIPGQINLPEEDFSEFSNSVKKIGQEYNLLACRLGKLFAEGLGLQQDELPISDKSYTMSIKHYPQMENEVDGEVIHPHHRDISPITILPGGTEAGLQVLRGEKYWDIVIPKGYVVANTGELLCNKTAGSFYGAVHRVVKKGKWPVHGRYQIALFTEFPDDFSLTPFHSLIEKESSQMNSTMKNAFIKQFMTGTSKDHFEAYQINVIGEDTTAEKINDLISKGFLRNPSQQLKNKFPKCDWGKAEEVNELLKEVGLTPLFTSSIS